MAEIRALLDRVMPGSVEDLALAWGARASEYGDAIAAAIACGETPVLVELAYDLPPTLDRAALLEVDHHGELAGRPTAIEQVFALLGLPPSAWTRRHALVAANDRGHVAGMQVIGASAAEIAAIRAEDRATQGVTAADEAEAWRAIAARRASGRLTEVETASASSTAVADLILPEMGGPGFDRLLVRMPGKLAAFADGEAIRRLAAHFSGGYWGGDLPRRGYWGLPAASERDVEIARTLLG